MANRRSFPRGRRSRLNLWLIERLERRACPAVANISAPDSVDEKSGIHTVEVSLSEPLPMEASVRISAGRSTARSGSDFYFMDTNGRAFTPGTFVFQPGETRQVLRLRILNDIQREPTETIVLNLTSPTNCMLGERQAVIKIVDDDSYTAQASIDSTVNLGDPVRVTLQLSSPATKTELFYVSALSGTARAGKDFEDIPRKTVMIAPGQSSLTVRIKTFSRSTFVGDKTFRCLVRSVTPGLLRPVGATVTIRSNAATTLSVTDAVLPEGSAGLSTAVLNVALSSPSASPVSVNWATLDGTATTADNDYIASSGQLVFLPGQTSKQITVQVVGDTRAEGNERFSLSLSAPTNASLSKATGTVTIVDDDAPLVLPAISISDISLSEGNAGTTNATLVVSLSTAVTNSVSVAFATADGTATWADNDYAYTTGSVVFAPGEVSKSITVPIQGDVRPEADEAFTVALSSPINATLAKAAGTVTIRNDDSNAIPLISVANATVQEGNSGTTPMTFLVTLSTASASLVTVQYGTSDVTASAIDGDYVAANGTLTFAPGETQKAVMINVQGDTKAEANEVFAIILNSPVNAVILAGAGYGTIRNDDAGLGSWTIMVYMTGGSLNDFAFQDINEMEFGLAGLPASVNIVVSWDQSSGEGAQAWPTGNGTQSAWDSYGRAKIQRDRNESTIVTPFEIFPADRNTGDAQTLVDFMRWGVQQAPAERYLLMMWGHGGGLIGSNFDAESGNDELSITEVQQSLLAPGVPTFDIVGYDSCLMGMVEVAYALQPMVPGFIVGSEESVPGYGHNYRTVFNALSASPYTVTSEAVATGIVQSFEAQRSQKLSESPNRRDIQYSMYAAVRTAALPALVQSVKAFVDTTLSFTSIDWQWAKLEKDSTNFYGASPAGSGIDARPFGDLGHFLFNMSIAPTPSALAASQAFRALKNAVTVVTLDPAFSSGLSIYLDPVNQIGPAEYFSLVPDFVQATDWDYFLYGLYNF